ncbi:energy transducer TonB family protein [Niabella aurantiaca]|uniref:energy transducer TonB family protein n=1 Tax=Niabella aurantiaca TaxID=379900 RepID=UPI00037DACE5|nr:energy transducer TonB [Niabella aurantiaca]
MPFLFFRKTSIVLLFSLLLSSSYGRGWIVHSFLRIDTIPPAPTYKIQSEAEFEGGKEAWKLFLQKNVQGDVPRKKGAPAGRYPVKVRFLINTDGTVGNVSIISDPGYGAAEELVRVIKLSSGKWKPAIIEGGKVIKSIRTQPMTFEVKEPAAKPPEIIRNYGFEYFDAQFKIVSWVPQNTKNGYIIVPTPSARSGIVSLLIMSKRNIEGERGSGLFNTIITKNVLDGKKKVTISAYIKTENLEDGAASLWMQLNGKTGIISDKNSDDKTARGNSDWTKYTIELPLTADVQSVGFGCKMTGKGKAWFDDFEVYVDGILIK